MAPLITLEQYKTSIGEPTTASSKDPQYTYALNAASDLIRNFTGLKFELNSGAVVTTRQFEYDGSGFLDIDEAQTITGVSLQSGYEGSTPRALSVNEWDAYPLNLPVKLWLRMPQDYGSTGLAPEMGFTYNLDTIGYRPIGTPSIVSVTAVWGWPTMPYDVQQAAVWTISGLVESQRPYQQESIENYSRTRGPDSQQEAIPVRAQVALLPYIITSV